MEREERERKRERKIERKYIKRKEKEIKVRRKLGNATHCVLYVGRRRVTQGF